MFSFFMKQKILIFVILSSLILELGTVLGSSLIYLFDLSNQKKFDKYISLLCGFMVSTLIISLIIPAYNFNNNIFLLIISFILGMLLIKYINKRLDSTVMLSYTLHNAPEGLAVGTVFSACNLSNLQLKKAWFITLSIAFQNIIDGLSVSIPVLKRKGLKKSAFIKGMQSGLIEIFTCIIGYFAFKSSLLLSIFLSFSSGCMTYTIIYEIIPIAKKHKLLTLIGFIIMSLIELIL